MSEAQPSIPPRTWRPAALWSAGILLALGLTWFVAAVVVPFWRTRAALAGEVAARATGVRHWPPIPSKAWADGETTAKRLAFYMKMPRWLAPHKPYAAWLLGYCGKNAEPALAAALTDTDAATRLAAARALGQMGPDAEAAAEALWRATGDSSPEVRQAAAEALRCIPYLGVKPDGLTGPSVFHAGFHYWAEPRPLLSRDWLLVVGGTVACRHIDTGASRDRSYLYPGGILCEKAFYVERDRREPGDWSYPQKYLALSDGLDGLQAGDKVIVFVSEFDGGAVVLPALGSNCRVGIKVDSWDDPIVVAVEKLCRAKDPREALKDAKVQQAWRRFDDVGVEATLRGTSYLEIQEEREKKP
jgi:hypothetical protein